MPDRPSRPRLRPAILFVAPALAGCSGADVLNALVPGDGYRVIRDLPYGTGQRERADLYIPAGSGRGGLLSAPAPPPAGTSRRWPPSP